MKFQTYTLDATLVIAVTYLVSAFAVVILPWRKPELWKASAASKFKLFGIPIVPVAGLATMGLIIYNLYEWLSNAAYGVNNHGSLVFMGLLYLLAVVVYIGARLVRSARASTSVSSTKRSLSSREETSKSRYPRGLGGVRTGGHKKDGRLVETGRPSF